MNTTTKLVLARALAAALLNLAAAGAAHAAEPMRRPLEPNTRRATAVTVDRYERPLVIERERTELRTHAVFSADPQPVEEGSILHLEIRSIAGETSTRRWQCVAVHDVAECLGNGVRVAYGPRDEKVVLVITAKPDSTAESIALIEAQRSERIAALAARGGATPRPALASARAR